MLKFLDLFIASPPHRLRYALWGDANAPAVFCLHGLTRNGRDFDFLARTLEPRHRIIAPDMPGRGASDRLPDPMLYSNALYAADCLALMDAHGIAQCDWVGTSMGGIVGMMVAGMQPQRIRRLVLNDIGATISAMGLKRIAAYAGTAPRFATRAEAEAALKVIYAPFGIATEAQWRHLFDHSLAKQSDGSWGFAYDPAILQGLIAAPPVEDIDLSALWNAVHCPVLLLRGGESDILTRETALGMAARPGVTLHEFPGIGHAPSLLREEEIAVVVKWLGRD